MQQLYIALCCMEINWFAATNYKFGKWDVNYLENDIPEISEDWFMARNICDDEAIKNLQIFSQASKSWSTIIFLLNIFKETQYRVHGKIMFIFSEKCNMSLIHTARQLTKLTRKPKSWDPKGSSTQGQCVRFVTRQSLLMVWGICAITAS